MNHVRRIFFAAVATLATAVLALTASPAAFATRLPPGGDGGTIAPPPPPVRVIEGGMPGWQITLIAIGAALLAATAAVLLDRARATRRNAVTAAS